MRNVTIGKTTFPFIGLSGKEGDSHRQEKFAAPGQIITGRSKAVSAAKRMEFKGRK